MLHGEVFSLYGRTSACQAEGRGFKSHRPFQITSPFLTTYPLNDIFAVMVYFGFASPGSDNRMTNEWQMSPPYEKDLNGNSVVTGWMSKPA